MPMSVPVVMSPELSQRIRRENIITAIIFVVTAIVIILAAYAGTMLHDPWPQTVILVFGAVFLTWGIIGSLLSYSDGRTSLAYVVEIFLLAFGLYFLIIVGKPLGIVILGGSLVAGMVDWASNRRNWTHWNYVILGLVVLVMLIAAYTAGTWAL